MKFFSKTVIGYLHTREKIPCEDYSLSYHDEERTIVGVADGHGGKIYVRSKLGSKFACNALLNAFKSLDKNMLKKDPESILKYLKLNALAEWNKMVEVDLAKNKLKASELKGLTDEEKFKLKVKPVLAYGSTMLGVMVFKKKVFILELGDGGSFFITKDGVKLALDDDDDAVANITYSLCGDNAYSHIHAKIVDLKDIKGVVIATDGAVNPYQSYDNFYEGFITPLTKLVKENNYEAIEKEIINLGTTKGIGDDVSLGFIFK